MSRCNENRFNNNHRNIIVYLDYHLRHDNLQRIKIEFNHEHYQDTDIDRIIEGFAFALAREKYCNVRVVDGNGHGMYWVGPGSSAE